MQDVCEAMKILITGPALAGSGGVASYYNAVLPHLRQQDDLGIQYLEIGSYDSSGGILHPLVDQVRFLRTLARIRPAVVHVNPSLNLRSFIRDGLFVYQAKRLGYPVVVFFRGWDENFESAVARMWLWFFRRTYLKADAFVVLATAVRNKLTEWGVSAPIQLGTTTVSSDLLRNFSISEKAEKLAADPLVKILFLSRVEKEKGVIEAMEAVTMLRAKGKPVALTVAGDGAAMRAVRKFADQHDALKEFLFIVGEVRGNNKSSLLASHHIFCFPSYTEGMPNSVLEAMAFGMPVITCPVGGLRDFFENGKMGYLAKQKSVTDIVDAIERLINDRNAMKSMSSYNYRYATERFLAPRAADFLTKVYRQVEFTAPKAVEFTATVRSPIFIVGTPRSGTTLMAGILGRHPNIFMPGETHFFDDIYARRNEIGDPRDPEVMGRIVGRLLTLYKRYYELPDQERVAQLLSDPSVFAGMKTACKDYRDVLSYFMEVQMRHEGKIRWGNNTPRDLFNVPEILALYPEAKFVVCTRDVRDFLLSYKEKWKITGAEHVWRLKQLYHPVVTSLLWKSSVRMLSGIEAIVPVGSLIVVGYEELVTNPEATVRKICRVVGEEFVPSMLDVDTHNSSYNTDGQGIFVSSVHRWRTALSAEEIVVAQWLTHSDLMAFGYPLDKAQPNFLRLAWILISAPYALIRALSANKGTRGPLIPYVGRRLLSLFRISDKWLH